MYVCMHEWIVYLPCILLFFILEDLVVMLLFVPSSLINECKLPEFTFIELLLLLLLPSLVPPVVFVTRILLGLAIDMFDDESFFFNLLFCLLLYAYEP